MNTISQGNGLVINRPPEMWNSVTEDNMAACRRFVARLVDGDIITLGHTRIKPKKLSL